MNHPTDPPSEEHGAAVMLRDQRRTDPFTLRPSPPGGRRTEVDVPTRAAGPGTSPTEPPPADSPPCAAQLRAELEERTADLQRVKAEYDNYRKRVQRDRMAIREIAVANVLGGLLPVLDVIDRADEFGEVTGACHIVTDMLESRLALLGLRSFGEPGDRFDPTLHEALTCTRSDRVDNRTCTTILRPGYRVGGHLLRPAQVAVTEPTAS